MTTPLQTWQFLIGAWNMVREKSAGADPDALERMIVTNYPAPTFIHMKSESWKGDELVGNGLSIMFYDQQTEQIKIKGFSGMGFVNNYNSTDISENKISFDSVNENVPSNFQHYQFRYHLVKKDANTIISTLEMAGEDGEYKKFWEGYFERDT